MCWNNINDVVILIIYIIGFFITLDQVNMQIYKLYKESKSELEYEDWLHESKWEGMSLILIFCWPLALIIIIIINIFQFLNKLN
jgi:heme/copper-type cytochrome/quinol oxidase subunit 2